MSTSNNNISPTVPYTVQKQPESGYFFFIYRLYKDPTEGRGPYDDFIPLVQQAGAPSYEYDGSAGVTTLLSYTFPAVFPDAYIVEIEDSTGGLDHYAVVLYPPVRIADLKVIPETVLNRSDGIVTAILRPGVAPYNWRLQQFNSTSQNWQTIAGGGRAGNEIEQTWANLASGDYRIVVTDSQNPITSDEREFSINAGPPELKLDVAIVEQHETLAGLNDGWISTCVLAGVFPVQLSLFDADNQPASNNLIVKDGTRINFRPLPPGEYEIRAIDGLDRITSHVLSILPGPALLVGDCMGEDPVSYGTGGTIRVTMRGGTAPYRYNLSSLSGTIIGNATNNRGIWTALAPGEYQVTVTDNTLPENQSFTCRQIINEFPTADLSLELLRLEPETGYRLQNGLIEIIANNVIEPVVYSLDSWVPIRSRWEPILERQDQPQGLFENLAPGTYRARAQDRRNQRAELTDLIISPSDPTPLEIIEGPEINPTTGFNSNDGCIRVTAIGQGQVRYQLQGPSGTTPMTNTDGEFCNLMPGIYDLQVKDEANQPLVVPNLIIPRPELPPFEIISEDSQDETGYQLEDGSVTVTAVGLIPLFYQLNRITGTGASVPIDRNDSGDFELVRPGLYQVKIEDNSIRSPLFSNPLTVDPAPPPAIILERINARPSRRNLPNGGLDFIAGGGVPSLNYTIDGPSGNFNDPKGKFDSLLPGDYEYFITDEAGQELTGQIAVPTLPNPGLTILEGPTINHQQVYLQPDGSLELLVEGLGTITGYLTLNGVPVTSDEGISPVNLKLDRLLPDTYDLRLVDSEQPGVQRILEDLTVLPAAPAPLIVSEPLVRDESGYRAEDGTISSIASGQGQINWSIIGSDGSNQTQAGTELNLNNLKPGNYDIRVTDQVPNRVPVLKSAIVRPYNLNSLVLAGPPIVDHQKEFRQPDGSIEVTVLPRGEGPVNYRLEPAMGIINPTITGGVVFDQLLPGPYTIIAEDNIPIGRVEEKVIVQPAPAPPLKILDYKITPRGLRNIPDASLQATGEGFGQLRFKLVEVDREATTVSEAEVVFDQLMQGQYTLELRDELSVEDINRVVIVTIDIPVRSARPITVTENITDQQIYGRNDGRIELVIEAEEPISVERLDLEETFEDPVWDNLAPGIYPIRITDVTERNLIVSPRVKPIQVPPLLIEPVVTTPEEFRGDNNGQIKVTTTSYFGEVSMKLTGPVNREGVGLRNTFQNLPPGEYQLKVMDEAFLEPDRPLIVEPITLNPGPNRPIEIISIETQPESNLGENDGRIEVIAQGPCNPITYKLEPSQPSRINTSGVFEFVPPGEYRVVLTDGGCNNDTISKPIIIAAGPPKPIEIINIVTKPTDLLNDTGIAEIEAIGQGPVRCSLQPDGPFGTCRFIGLPEGPLPVYLQDDVQEDDTVIVIGNVDPDEFTWAQPIRTQDPTSYLGYEGEIEIFVQGQVGNVTYEIIPNPDNRFLVEPGTTGPKTNDNLFKNLPAGRYTIRVNDQLGRELTAPARLKPVAPPNLEIIRENQEPESGFQTQDGIITILAQGVPPISYEIVFPNSIANENPANISGGRFTSLSAGEYELLLIDNVDPLDRSPQITTTITVGGGQPSNMRWITPPQAQAESDYQTRDGIICALAEGEGVIGYDLILADGNRIDMIFNSDSGLYCAQNLAPGAYVVEARDEAEQELKQQIIVPAFNTQPLIITEGPDVTNHSNGITPGKVRVRAIGQGEITYRLTSRDGMVDESNKTGDFNNVPGKAKPYNLLVKDQAVPPQTENRTVNVPLLSSRPLEVDGGRLVTTTDETGYELRDGTATINAKGGVPPLTYEITGTDINNNAVNLTQVGDKFFPNLTPNKNQHQYTARVFDSSGQELTGPAPIAPAPADVLRITVGPISRPEVISNDGSVSYTAIGQGNITHVLPAVNNASKNTNSGEENTFNGLAAGSYELLLRDEGGQELKTTIKIGKLECVCQAPNVTVRPRANDIEIEFESVPDAEAYAGGITFDIQGEVNRKIDGVDRDVYIVDRYWREPFLDEAGQPVPLFRHQSGAYLLRYNYPPNNNQKVKFYIPLNWVADLNYLDIDSYCRQFTIFSGFSTAIRRDFMLKNEETYVEAGCRTFIPTSPRTEPFTEVSLDDIDTYTEIPLVFVHPFIVPTDDIGKPNNLTVYTEDCFCAAPKIKATTNPEVVKLELEPARNANFYFISFTSRSWDSRNGGQFSQVYQDNPLYDQNGNPYALESYSCCEPGVRVEENGQNKYYVYIPRAIANVVETATVRTICGDFEAVNCYRPVIKQSDLLQSGIYYYEVGCRFHEKWDFEPARNECRVSASLFDNIFIAVNDLPSTEINTPSTTTNTGSSTAVASSVSRSTTFDLNLVRREGIRFLSNGTLSRDIYQGENLVSTITDDLNISRPPVLGNPILPTTMNNRNPGHSNLVSIIKIDLDGSYIIQDAAGTSNQAAGRLPVIINNNTFRILVSQSDGSYQELDPQENIVAEKIVNADNSIRVNRYQNGNLVYRAEKYRDGTATTFDYALNHQASGNRIAQAQAYDNSAQPTRSYFVDANGNEVN